MDNEALPSLIFHVRIATIKKFLCVIGAIRLTKFSFESEPEIISNTSEMTDEENP